MRIHGGMRWTGVIAVIAGTVIALGGVFAGAAWAPNGTPNLGIGIGTGFECNPTTGQYDVRWTFHNSSQADPPIVLTLTSAVMTPTGTELVTQFEPSGPIGQGASASAPVISFPGTTVASLSLATTFIVDPGGGGTPYEDEFDTFPQQMTGNCQASTIQVGPSAAGPGETVTISGTACFFDRAQSLETLAGGTVTGSVAFTPPLAFGPITAAADGTWSTSVVVPAGTPPGSYAVSATCALPLADFESNAAVSDSVAASVRGQASADFAYETKYLTVVSTAKTAEAVVAVPRTTG